MAADDRPPLPNAVSVGDELLVALIGELRGLRDDVRALAPPRRPPAAPPAVGEVELREPKPTRSRSRSRSPKKE